MSDHKSADQHLSPPRPRFVEETDNEPEPFPSASRPTTSSTASLSPPTTPRSPTFAAAYATSPFSPAPSVRSLDAQQIATEDRFPQSAAPSRAQSTADLPRLSYYGRQSSHVSTGDVTSRASVKARAAFTSPPQRPLTLYSTAIAPATRERAKSTMLTSSPDKPWLTQRDPFARIAYFLTYAVVLVGLAAGVVRCYTSVIGIHIIKPQNLCLVMDEDFSDEAGVFGDNGRWFREVDMSGFGNGEFEMTTASENNSYVRDGHLYIVPTLTADAIGAGAVLDGTVYNITGCTFNTTQGNSYTSSSTTPMNATASGPDGFDVAAYLRACSAVSNATTGAVINPIQSARLSTRKSASIRYGKVEVVAKIPTGDWMWPAIWMLPVDGVYGPWPQSGEIDIMEARGNGPAYPAQGTNYVRGSLNWGPLPWLNAVFRTYGWWTTRRGSYDNGFHTYGLEWTEDSMRLYVDSRLHHMLDLSIKGPFWDFGDFPPVVQNGSQTVVLQNPWINGTKAAPFDQSFYLILDVAVGGTNGWFPDNQGSKPWLDGSLTAMRDFVNSQAQWLPTWPTDVEKRAMVVDSVKMWQKC